MYDDKITDVWEKYQKGVDHHNGINLYKETERNHRFYIGDQWHGAKTGGEDLPIFNFIKPVGKYKISMIAQNSMSITFGNMGKDPETTGVTDMLTKFSAAQWEKSKMDTIMWTMIKRTFITGDNYLYCFDDRGQNPSITDVLKPALKHRLVNNTNIYFSDEQNPVIDEQEWIIISERLPVSKVRKIAEDNGISKEDIERIVSDEETDTQIGENVGNEVKTKLGKCTSVLYFKKTKEGIKFCRSTETVVYQPEQIITGLDTYPIVGMRWEEIIGSSRGASGVKHMIPNQLEVNKTAARRALAVKRFAFPTLAYDNEKVSNADKLTEIGASIKIKNLQGNPINSLISYLNPAPISSDAERLQNEFIDQTQKLEGAGDAAMGQVDPTKASGEAIKAARDQAAVPLNEQIAAYKQLVEDIALLWYKMWVAYSPNGLQVQFKQDGQPVSAVIPQEILQSLDIDIRVDVSPVDPYSKISQEIALERLLQGEYITFEEYVKDLDDQSSVPKSKLEQNLSDRAIALQQQEQSQVMQLQKQLQEAMSVIQQLTGQQSGLPQVPESPQGVPPEMMGGDQFGQMPAM